MRWVFVTRVSFVGQRLTRINMFLSTLNRDGFFIFQGSGSPCSIFTAPDRSPLHYSLASTRATPERSRGFLTGGCVRGSCLRLSEGHR